MNFKSIIIIFLTSFSIFGQTTQKNSRELWIFTTGNFVNQNAHRIIAEDWPFKVKSKGGDVLDNLLIERVNKHNTMVWEELEAEGYKNPEKNYYNLVNNEARKIDKIIELINKNKYLNQKMKTIVESNRIKLPRIIKINDSLYQLNMLSILLSDIDSTEKVEFKIVGNICSNELFIINKGY